GWLESGRNGKLSQIRKNLISYFSNEKKRIAEETLDQALKAFKIESTGTVLKDLIKIFQNKKLSVERATEFVKQREDLLNIFIKIFYSIAITFPDKKFLLIIDKLERAGKTAIDF